VLSAKKVTDIPDLYDSSITLNVTVKSAKKNITITKGSSIDLRVKKYKTTKGSSQRIMLYGQKKCKMCPLQIQNKQAAFKHRTNLNQRYQTNNSKYILIHFHSQNHKEPTSAASGGATWWSLWASDQPALDPIEIHTNT
jgi:hypothetical protein